MKSIQPFIQRKVVVLHEDSTIQQAARAMKDHQIGCVVVADHRGHIVGIVTDRDVAIGSVSGSKKNGERPIKQVMSRNIAFVVEGSSLKQVTDLMEQQGVRRIPVIRAMSAGTQHCVGVVVLDDLIAAKAVGIDPLSRIVRAQMKRKLFRVRRATDIRKERKNFYDRLQLMLAPKLGSSRSELDQLAMLVLSGLVRKLHHTGALKFIGTLPAFTQPALLALPAGPDEAVNLAWLTAEVCRLFEVDDATAHQILASFGALLEEWCDEEALEHVKAQLPNDLRGIFAAPKVKGKRKVLGMAS